MQTTTKKSPANPGSRPCSRVNLEKPPKLRFLAEKQEGGDVLQRFLGISFERNGRFDGVLWPSPSACLPICLWPGGRGGINKQIGRQVGGFPLFRCGPRDTQEIGVFVGTGHF